MAIYTKRGDRGETSLYDSQSSQQKRISKDSLRIAAIGSLDETSSFLGALIAFSKDSKLNKTLENFQRDLFTIGSILAGAKLKLEPSRVKEFEKIIDELEGRLPVLANFILPGGGKVGSLLHFTRTQVRKSERAVVALNKKEKVKPEVLEYLNRLSDLLFMLARSTNIKEGRKEKIWIGNK